MNPSPDIPWKITTELVALTRDKFWARYSYANMPEKSEAIHSKLFWDDKQRLHVLAMPQEAVSLKQALSICPPEVVRAAPAEEPR